MKCVICRVFNIALCSTNAESDKDVYRMDHPKRGVFIIINNRHFLRLSERVGTDVDASHLYQLFMELGFDVRLEQNKTAAEMLMILDKGKGVFYIDVV